jgi:hypothetical protein
VRTHSLGQTLLSSAILSLANQEPLISKANIIDPNMDVKEFPINHTLGGDANPPYNPAHRALTPLVAIAILSMIGALGFNQYAQHVLGLSRGQSKSSKPLKFLGLPEGLFGFRRAQVKSFSDIRDIVWNGYSEVRVEIAHHWLP